MVFEKSRSVEMFLAKEFDPTEDGLVGKGVLGCGEGSERRV